VRKQKKESEIYSLQMELSQLVGNAQKLVTLSRNTSLNQHSRPSSTEPPVLLLPPLVESNPAAPILARPASRNLSFEVELSVRSWGIVFIAPRTALGDNLDW